MGDRTAPAPVVPTSQQELLLRAALLRGPAGLGSWQAWRAGARLEALDPDSQWLLPLLYHNLHAQHVAPDLLTRYRNVYLHNWYRNNLILWRSQPALARLQRLRESVVLVRGGAVALRHYDALGARPFERLSVLVRQPPAQILAEAGVADPALDVQTALFDAETDEIVVRRASEIRWKALRGLVLDPADQLVDICVRRHQWDGRSRLLWVADAAMTVWRSVDLDWGRVVALAGRVNRRADVASALRYLGERVGIALPPAVAAVLAPRAGEVSL